MYILVLYSIGLITVNHGQNSL